LNIGGRKSSRKKSGENDFTGGWVLTKKNLDTSGPRRPGRVTRGFKEKAVKARIL